MSQAAQSATARWAGRIALWQEGQNFRTAYHPDESTQALAFVGSNLPNTEALLPGRSKRRIAM